MEPLQIIEFFQKQIPGVLGMAVGFPGEKPVEVNGSHVFPAASLIKVPILFHLFEQSERRGLDLSELISLNEKDKVDGSGVIFELHAGINFSLLDLGTLMIVISDNTATNLLMDRLGQQSIQDMIQRLELKNTVLGRKMMIRPNDPPANFTTPLEMFELFEKLLLNKILSPKNTELALNILFRQQYNEKIPLHLPKDVKVAHKTGEISGVRHDCGVIKENTQSLILCLLTKDLSNEIKGDRLLAELALALYLHYFKKEPA